MESQKTPPLEIWYDGNCPLCRRSRQWCERRDPEGRLRFRDSNAEAGDLPVSAAEAAASMWVTEGDDQPLEGFFGWRRMMAELPGWRWLARLSHLPPVSWLGPPIYRFVARNRRRFGWLPE